MTPRSTAQNSLRTLSQPVQHPRQMRVPQVRADDDSLDSMAAALTDGLSGADTPAAADDATYGMPAERQARMAARRAFVALKLSFLYVVESLLDRPELQSQVRQAEEPHELWGLRAAVFAALTEDSPLRRSQRQLLNRSLETMFPMSPARLN